MLFLATALAGTVFHVGEGGLVYSFDTRTMVSTPLIYGGPDVYQAGLAYDRADNALWLYGPWNPYIQNAVYYYIDLDAMTSVWAPSVWGADALAFDPLLGEVVSVKQSGFRTVSGAYLGPGLDTFGADWFDDGGFVVAINNADGGFYDVSTPGGPTYLGGPLSRISSPLGLAYDADTKMFLAFSSNGGVDLIEPETFAHIGSFAFATFVPNGAAGSMDNVPQQTPALIVSAPLGCPGPATVTVVDATPGGHVQVGSSTRLGRSTVRGGACAGTRLGLQRPTPRLDLVANSYGIAWTTFDAPAWMCGNLHVQAVDMDSCLATEVGTIETVVLP